MIAGKESIRIPVVNELADLHFSSVAPVLANLLVTLIAAAALLWEHFSLFVVGWAICNGVVCAARIWLWRSYQRRRHTMFEPQLWLRRSTLLAAATGLLWGVLGLATAIVPSPMNTVMVPMLILGVSATGVSSLTSYLPAIRVVIYPCCLSAAVAQAMAGGAPHIVLAVLALVFLVNLDQVARRAHRAVIQTLLAKLAKERSEEHLARAQRVATTGSVERDLATGVEEWSEEMYRLWGVDPHSFSVSEENVLAAVHENDRERVRAARAAQRTGKPMRPGEFRVVRSDGEVKTLYVEIDIQRDRAGKPIRVLNIVKDVTELRAAENRQKEMEQQLQQAQKLEALGTLAGGVAHELNNTLVPVLALAKTTIKLLPEGSREQRNLVAILHAGERARDLVERIVAFSRKDMPTRVEVDLAAITRDALNVLRHNLPATIAIAERIEPVPPMLGDPNQLPQIVINLVTNAIQAMANRTGTITIELAPAAVEKLPQTSEGAASNAICLSVIDDGRGMDKATRARIYEPFFTTKGVGEGTGLGLSVVHGIVIQHGGRIAVESEPGHGARFDVYLPALIAGPAARPVETAAAA
jgi:PAS domain S-box-containing protein